MKSIIFLLLLLCSNCFAQSSGWTFQSKPGISSAFIINEAQSETGILCMQRCFAYIDTKTPCKEGEKIAFLISSKEGSSSESARCFKIGNAYISMFDSTERLMNAYFSGSTIGFAYSLENGTFAVNRFSTKGARDVIMKMLEFAKGQEQTAPKDTGKAKEFL